MFDHIHYLHLSLWKFKHPSISIRYPTAIFFSYAWFLVCKLVLIMYIIVAYILLNRGLNWGELCPFKMSKKKLCCLCIIKKLGCPYISNCYSTNCQLFPEIRLKCISYFIFDGPTFINIKRGRRARILLTSLSPPHCCVCSKPGPGFPTPYVLVFFVFSGLKWEVIAHFVDVGGIA
jgi:hypothetical protein